MDRALKHAGKTSASHSVRCTDDLWERARKRARYDGVTMNYVVSAILEGYADGHMDLPTVVKEFTPTRAAS